MHQYDTQVWPLDEDAVKLIPAIERVREDVFRRCPASEEYVRRTGLMAQAMSLAPRT
jgi:hypothetical protein